MMDLDIYVVDAFTNELFKGNSAAVVIVEHWLPIHKMQNIAAENNLSETAFVKSTGNNTFAIRWFSPITEIDFCGHATLASAHVLFFELDVKGTITFTTNAVGELHISKNDSDQIVMDFPNQKPELIDQVPPALINGLSIKPTKILKNRQAYFAVFDTEHDVRQVDYNSEQLKSLAPFDVVVTSTSEQYDFISRYFWPANGGDEDPVTGSIHTGLAPYWAEQLNKTELIAYQASNRGGVLYCTLQNDRVVISGYSKLYMKGKIYL